MDMKSYILVGGGLLICLVLLHALVSAWRAKRRLPSPVGEDRALGVLDMEADDDAELLWNDDAREPVVEESVAEEGPEPPVLMEPMTATAEPATHAQSEHQDIPETVAEEETAVAEAVELPPPVEMAPSVELPPPVELAPPTVGGGVVRKGRRVEIPGKRTEPTVPRTMRPEFHQFTPPPERNEPVDEPPSLDEVIVVWVFARSGRQLNGEALLRTFVSHGLKCDADRVFKKTDPRCGGLWYSVANGVEPGTFDVTRPAALETPGVVMLLPLGEVRDPGPAFEDLLDVAQDLAIALDAELKDERMSDMSAQTIEHCRQRIRDHRRMLLRA